MKKLWRVAAVLAALALLGAMAAVAYAHKAASTGNAVSTAAGGTTYALVVGISDFEPCDGGGPDLQFADDDADAFKTALTTGVYDIPVGNIKLLKDCAATKTAILNELDLTISGSVADKTGTNDDLVVFISGHGSRGFGFLLGCTPDGEMIDNAVLTHDLGYICDNDLKALVTADNAKRKVVILDISFPSGFKDDFQSASDTLLVAAARGEARELDYPSTHPCNDYSGAPGGHGIFTCWFVVRGILGDEADNPALNPHALDDDQIPFEEAYDYTVHASKGPFAQKPDIVDNLLDDVLVGP